MEVNHDIVFYAFSKQMFACEPGAERDIESGTALSYNKTGLVHPYVVGELFAGFAVYDPKLNSVISENTAIARNEVGRVRIVTQIFGFCGLMLPDAGPAIRGDGVFCHGPSEFSMCRGDGCDPIGELVGESDTVPGRYVVVFGRFRIEPELYLKLYGDDGYFRDPGFFRFKNGEPTQSFLG